MCRLLFTYVVCSSLIQSTFAGTDNNCILNEFLPPSQPGNYMDCSNDDDTHEDDTTCCDVEGGKVCCSSNKRWEKVRMIAIGVGCTTVVLGMLLFTALWCNVEARPCGYLTRLFCCCGRPKPRRPSHEVINIEPMKCMDRCHTNPQTEKAIVHLDH